jgi:hypothetical protein
MTMRKLIVAASLFSALFAAGGLQSAPANAAFAQPQAQIAKIVKLEAIQQVRGKHGGARRFARGGARRFAGGNFRPWRWCKNHPARCFRAHRRFHRHWHGYGVQGVRHPGPRCHRHLYPVPGMHFHAAIRCGHHHHRAFDSWVWAP